MAIKIKTLEERTIENYKAQLKLLQGSINESVGKIRNNQFLSLHVDSFLENFEKIQGIKDEELKIDLNTTNALEIELKNSKDELISIYLVLNSSPSRDISSQFFNLKNKLEYAYNAFIRGIEIRQRINDYNKAFNDEIRLLNKRRKSNIKRVKIFGVLAVILLCFLILLAVFNFPFNSHAQKIICLISDMKEAGVEVNHSLIYFLPKLLYVSCLLFLINICYNNYSFHKNLANLYRDKMDMANQLLALLEAGIIKEMGG